MTLAATKKSAQRPERSDARLDQRYGKIGISAVAAALPYADEAKKKDAEQPVDALREERWLRDYAA